MCLPQQPSAPAAPAPAPAPQAAKAPDTPKIMAERRKNSMSPGGASGPQGSGGTVLTGMGGVQNSDMPLSRATLLGQ